MAIFFVRGRVFLLSRLLCYRSRISWGKKQTTLFPTKVLTSISFANRRPSPTPSRGGLRFKRNRNKLTKSVEVPDIGHTIRLVFLPRSSLVSSQFVDWRWDCAQVVSRDFQLITGRRSLGAAFKVAYKKGWSSSRWSGTGEFIGSPLRRHCPMWRLAWGHRRTRPVVSQLYRKVDIILVELCLATISDSWAVKKWKWQQIPARNIEPPEKC